MSKFAITQKELKRLFDYDKNTGIFTRKICTANRHVKGETVGADTGHGYLKATIYSNAYYLHRLAWLYVYGWLPKSIDHINHDGTDNRINNLRECSQSDNLKNRRLSSSNKTGLHGVYKRKDYNAWDSEIGTNNRRLKLGTFKDFFEAVCARKSAEAKFNFHSNHGTKL